MKVNVTEKKQRNSMRIWRTVTVIGIVLVYIVGFCFNAGIGSICGFGIDSVASVCPVGLLQTVIAGKVVLPLPLIIFTVFLLLTVLFGRVFCGWVCPIPLFRKLTINKEEKDYRIKNRKGSAGGWPSIGKGQTTALGVLVVTLVTTLIFGFPVFCLVCPVGLLFASIFAFIRLIAYNELIIDIVIFPLLIVLELLVLRKWCSSLCPIGALLGLVSRFNKTFIPTIDAEKCISTQETHCNACHNACNFDIDLVHGLGDGAISDCVKCGECANHCPTQAISFPFSAKNGTHANSGCSDR